MISILLVSEMTPDAPCGVVTYYQKVMEQFSTDSEVEVELVTVADAFFLDKKLAGLAKKLISLFAFVDKRIAMYADELFYRTLIQSALKKYKGRQLDFIHAQEPRSAYYSKSYFKGRIPVILTCHFNDNPVQEDLLLYQVKKSTLKHFLTQKYKRQLFAIDHLIFVSKYCLKKTEYLLHPYSKVTIIHNGVNFEGLPQNNLKKERRAKVEIINTGHIEKRKNQKLLVLIAQELLNLGFKNFHITILGTGPDLPDLKEMIQNHNLEAYFSLPGWVTNVNDYLDRSDLYIHTSSNDNCPYSVIESIARNTPVLGFRVGGLTEILDDQFLFQLNDTIAIAQYVVENFSILEQIATIQYLAIEQEFSIQNQLKQLKRLYYSSQTQQTLLPVG